MATVNIKDLLILSCIPGIGHNRLRSLVTHFKNSTDALNSSAREIINIEGFNKKLAVTVSAFKKSGNYHKAEQYAVHQLSKMNKSEGGIITFWDDEYPDLLKKIYDPPCYLFIKGNFKKEDKYSIAIVGTRNPSTYGVTMAEKFTQELARLGITIVSGLARGVDSVAHSSALKVGGRTIGVLGSGIDVIYPPENKNLYSRIAQNGGVISEYAMGTKPDAGNFPRRNRIVSGMTLGTIIIETGIDGGAMITANTALDQNRDVFAIPGLITEVRALGCNTLIRDGRAKLITTVDDVLSELSAKLKPLLREVTKHEKKIDVSLSLFEKKIYDTLDDEPIHIDLLAEKSGMPTSDALVNLLSLEFKGLVRQLPGKMFVRL
ncbi:MAG: DNA-processing protein DprA [Bacteroidota bacterium]|nr:DNA-processing protein DprA [Bacteroidota bacterium]